MMNLSEETKEVIQIAYDVMLKSPEHTVLPFHRRIIYDSLMRASKSEDVMIYKKLAIVSARYVLPVWQAAQPFDRKLEQLLYQTDLFLKEKIEFQKIHDQAEAAWVELDNFGGTVESDEIGNAYYAGIAIVVATLEATGKRSFLDEVISESQSDFDIDMFSYDTAYWAASSYGGRIGYPDANPEKRIVFWTWWLKEAIPNTIRI
jgi:hypothetical protein